MKHKSSINIYLLLFSSVTLSLLLFCSAAQKQDKPVSLKDTFKDKYLIGTALNYNQITGKNPKSLKLALEQFNSITPENILKWGSVHPKPDKYNFAPVDSLIKIAEDNNMFLVGHTLIWHSQTPDWVFKDNDGNPLSREKLLQRMKEHIFKVVGRYKGKINGWDVVNEAFEDDGKMRQSKWQKIIGNDYMEKAFRWAHEADPDAELYYNDYNMWYAGKRDAVVKLVNDFKNKGIVIHGIGLQGHWGLEYPPLDELENSIKAFAATGMKIMVTELDLDMLPMPGENTGADVNLSYEKKEELDPWPNGLPDSMQTKIADRYAAFFTIFNKYSDAISRITLWGVSDAQSWRNYWPIYKRTAYPLLFDRNLKPKKAFYEVINTVKEK
jgi:endo-1,4-beta-xylanase